MVDSTTTPDPTEPAELEQFARILALAGVSRAMALTSLERSAPRLASLFRRRLRCLERLGFVEEPARNPAAARRAPTPVEAARLAALLEPESGEPSYVAEAV